jgi:hypothetical protein
VPVVGDLPALHAIYVNRAEANRPAIAFSTFEGAGEMSREEVSNNRAIVAYQCISGSAELFGVVRSHATR